MCCRTRGSLCNTIGLIVGLFVGIGAGLLFNYELLPGLTTVLPIVLAAGAIAAVTALVGLGLAAYDPNTVLTTCLAQHGGRWLAGALGTVVGVILLLLFTTPTLFTLQLVLVAATAFFFAYLLVQVVCTVTCILRGLTTC